MLCRSPTPRLHQLLCSASWLHNLPFLISQPLCSLVINSLLLCQPAYLFFLLRSFFLKYAISWLSNSQLSLCLQTAKLPSFSQFLLQYPNLLVFQLLRFLVFQQSTLLGSIALAAAALFDPESFFFSEKSLNLPPRLSLNMKLQQSILLNPKNLNMLAWT